MADVHIHLPLSAGVHPNADAPAARSGMAGIRRSAVAKIYSRDPSDGGRRVNEPGPAPAANAVTQEPPHSAPTGKTPDRNKKPLEKTPPFAKEQLMGDGWNQASEKARQLHRKAK